MTATNDPLAERAMQPSPAELVPDEFDLLCEHCGYSLVGITSDRCPECGDFFYPAKLPPAHIPWHFRRRIGNVHAYLQTFWMVIRHPVKFVNEMCRPVRCSEREAKRFCRATVWLATAGMALIPIASICAAAPQLGLFDSLKAILVAMIITAGFWTFFSLSTLFPKAVWDGQEHDSLERAPWKYYAAAPLALSVINSPILIGTVVISNLTGSTWVELTCVIAAGAFIVGSVFLTWWLPQVFMHNATKCSPWKLAILAIYIPFHWAIVGFVVAFVALFAITCIVPLNL
jgi:hypothetical protein